jgi:hypothetical protein
MGLCQGVWTVAHWNSPGVLRGVAGLVVSRPYGFDISTSKKARRWWWWAAGGGRMPCTWSVTLWESCIRHGMDGSNVTSCHVRFDQPGCLGECHLLVQ